MPPTSRVAVLGGAVAWVLAVGSIAAAQFTFTDIANTTDSVPGGGGFAFFNQSPAASNSVVAFQATVSGANGTVGLFTGSGAAITVIARGGVGAPNQVPVGGRFSTLSNPSISDSFVAFFGQYVGGSGLQGIFRANSSVISAIAIDGSAGNAAPDGGTFSGFGTEAEAAISGERVAFRGLLTGGPGTEGIYIGTPTDLEPIVRGGVGGPNVVPGGGVFNNFGTPDIDGDAVAFVANVSSGSISQGIFTVMDGDIDIIAGDLGSLSSAPGGGSFFNLRDPAISDGRVAFRSSLSGSSGTEGIYTNIAGVLTAVARGGIGAPNQAPDGTRLEQFGDASISGNNVAFFAQFNNGLDEGIFLWSGGNRVTVIRTGDLLFGSTVAELGFDRFGLSGNRLAFWYALDNGVEGVALASGPPALPTPTPTATPSPSPVAGSPTPTGVPTATATPRPGVTPLPPGTQPTPFPIGDGSNDDDVEIDEMPRCGPACGSIPWAFIGLLTITWAAVGRRKTE